MGQVLLLERFHVISQATMSTVNHKGFMGQLGENNPIFLPKHEVLKQWSFISSSSLHTG